LVVAFPLFLDGVDVEDALLLAVLDEVGGGCANGEVDAKADLAGKDLVEDGSEVLAGEGDLEEGDGVGGLWKFDGFRVDDGDFIKLEVAFDQGQGALADRAVAHDADVVYVTVKLMLLHWSLNSL
jgi:hypothetical protein